MTTQIVILAAGMGSRLGRSLPKPLTELNDGRTIMQQQFDNIHQAFGNDVKVTIVVGYKLEHIIEAFPHASFVYNEQYDQTNTSKSLLRALQASKDGGVLWMNGDVVFDPEALVRAGDLVAATSFVSINTAKVCDEEVKYTTDAEGFIDELSKTVTGGLGEAVGINFVSSRDKAALVRQLAGRRPGLLRARHRARDRAGQAALRAGRHLRPVRGRDRLRRRPRAREPLRLRIRRRGCSASRR